ncbi:TPA: outer membrane protein assembly factor BamE domain-containing protein [Salmonella enterica subsp. enterica]
MMKLRLAKLLLLVAAVTLSGCHQNPSHPKRDGSIKEAVWPVPEKARLGTGQGVFPTSESIALLNKGMTKDQVYMLIGRPHFNEGLFFVREWDYLLHFRTVGSGTNGVTTCQLKIIFNSDKLVSGIYWRAIDTRDALCPPVPEKQKNGHGYIFNADMFFGLNQYQLDTFNPDVRRRLDKIISGIRETGEYESITVYGYTDWQGDWRYNMKLSALRAKSVADFLIENGFSERKLFFKGMGETIPETDCPGLNHEELTECLLPDRKVIIVVNPINNNSQ